MAEWSNWECAAGVSFAGLLEGGIDATLSGPMIERRADFFV
jgi:hypothetical protein